VSFGFSKTAIKHRREFGEDLHLGDFGQANRLTLWGTHGMFFADAGALGQNGFMFGALRNPGFQFLIISAKGERGDIQSPGQMQGPRIATQVESATADDGRELRDAKARRQEPELAASGSFHNRFGSIKLPGFQRSGEEHLRLWVFPGEKLYQPYPTADGPLREFIANAQSRGEIERPVGAAEVEERIKTLSPQPAGEAETFVPGRAGMSQPVGPDPVHAGSHLQNLGSHGSRHHMEFCPGIIAAQGLERRDQVNGIPQEAEVYDYDLPGAPGFFVKRGESFFQWVKAAMGSELW